MTTFPSDFWIDRLAADVMGAGDDPVVSDDLWIVWRRTWDAVIDLVRECNTFHGDFCDPDCEVAVALDALRKLAP